jgi:membrane protease YdiL (CAAX protease family)
MLLVRQLVGYLWREQTLTSVLIREAGMWLVALALIAIVKIGERLPLSSIGLGTARVGKSLLRGLLVGVVCFLLAGAFSAATGFRGGEALKTIEKLPLWLVALIVLRAGVVEELCYRGYTIERLQAMGLPPAAAGAVPLVIFGFAHWTGGWGNIGLALLLGAALAAFYLWRRDLVANMFGHWLVDFVPNVLFKLRG